MLVIYATFSSGWLTLTSEIIYLSILSGFIGILVGDTALFLALNRIGPRRLSILFSLNAPISAVLAWFLLNESLSGRGVIGVLLCVVGVAFAIFFARSPSSRPSSRFLSRSSSRRSSIPSSITTAKQHQWEETKGKLWAGVALGLLAALSQSIGTLIARPIMETGADPVAVSAIRTGVAAVGLSILLQLNLKNVSTNKKLTVKIFGLILLSGAIGMAVGMTLLLFALTGGKVGVVATLSATTPVIILPLIWIKTGKAPAVGAWVGAFLVIIGCALIFTR